MGNYHNVKKGQSATSLFWPTRTEHKKEKVSYSSVPMQEDVMEQKRELKWGLHFAGASIDGQNSGVYVTRVKDGGLMHRNGIQKDDIIDGIILHNVKCCITCKQDLISVYKLWCLLSTTEADMTFSFNIKRWKDNEYQRYTIVFSDHDQLPVLSFQQKDSSIVKTENTLTPK